MKTKIFVDGEHGTTGLKILEHLKERNDLEMVSIPYAERHNLVHRQHALQEADIAILCLPDQAARETVAYIQEQTTTRVIDASTAHRTDPQWVYGFAELTKEQKNRIRSARFVSNPGCYATGALALIRPLREANFISENYPFIIHAVSGYTGGGKQMIAEMEQDNPPSHHFTYALNHMHKHIPEIMQHGCLSVAPIFTPSVGYFPQGMSVFIPLHPQSLEKNISIELLHDLFNRHYAESSVVSVADLAETAQITRLVPENFSHRDDLKISIFSDPQESHFILAAELDNLGKGASGAAVQNLDLMLGY